MENLLEFSGFIFERMEAIKPSFINALLGWLEWADEEDSEMIRRADRILRSAPKEFIWTGPVWRFRAGDMEMPDDVDRMGAKSFSKTLNGLATVIHAFNYGGAQDVSNGVTVFRDVVTGLDVTGVLSHLKNEGMLDEMLDRDQRGSMPYWMSCEEIIAPYNSPKKAGTADLIGNYGEYVRFSMAGEEIVLQSAV